MKAIVLKNNIVTNIISVDENTDLSLFDAVPYVENAKIGYIYENGVFSYIEKVIDVDQKKQEKLKQVKEAFEQAVIRPRVQTNLGFDVDGGYQDLTNFQNGLDIGISFIRDADNNKQSVTTTDLNTIIEAIKVNGLSLYQRKWDLEDAIKTATMDDLSEIVW